MVGAEISQSWANCALKRKPHSHLNSNELSNYFSSLLFGVFSFIQLSHSSESYIKVSAAFLKPPF